MSKFRKISSSSGSKNFKDFAGKLFSKKDFFDLINLGGKDGNFGEIQSFFSNENSKRNLNYIAGLLMGFPMGDGKPYSSEAFQHVLKTPGYQNTNASQGAYEKLSPEIIKQLEEFKKNPPKNLIDYATKERVTSLENENISETDPRYKAMKETLSNISQKRFIKTSANQGLDELKKVMPEWTIENVIKDMAKVANNKMMSSAEKQKNMFAVLNQYENFIAPLGEYLQKNGIKPE